MTLWSRSHYYPHFTEERTEAERGKISSSRLVKWQRFKHRSDWPHRPHFDNSHKSAACFAFSPRASHFSVPRRPQSVSCCPHQTPKREQWVEGQALGPDGSGVNSGPMLIHGMVVGKVLCLSVPLFSRPCRGRIIPYQGAMEMGRLDMCKRTDSVRHIGRTP